MLDGGVVTDKRESEVEAARGFGSGVLDGAAASHLHARPSEADSAATADDVLDRFDRLVRHGELAALAPIPTGFRPLDRVLDGGLRPGDIVLVGGVQGGGKTTLTLQMARNLASQGDAACGYVCYEHEELYLLQRLLALEGFLARRAPRDEAFTLSELRGAVSASGSARNGAGPRGLGDLLRKLPRGEAALEGIRGFGPRLHLQTGSGSETDVAALRRLVRDLKARHGPRVALFVDHLQKVPVLSPTLDEEEQAGRAVKDLKDLALREGVPIVAVTTTGRAGLEAQRLRLHHLRGSSSLSFESDVVLILNNKYRIVSRTKIAYNYHKAQDLRQWVVCSIEKNRSGPDLIDLEFRAHFAHAAFDPIGSFVAETLIDERIDV